MEWNLEIERRNKRDNINNDKEGFVSYKRSLYGGYYPHLTDEQLFRGVPPEDGDRLLKEYEKKHRLTFWKLLRRLVKL